MVVTIISDILTAYLVVIILWVVLSWFPIQADSPLMPVVRVLHALTEPVLGPVRKALPPVRTGAMSLDLSPLIVVFALILLRQLI